MREVYEKIKEKIKECRDREHDCSVYEEQHNWYVSRSYTHPDRHLYEVLEEIFRPIEESSSITAAEFFTALFNKKNNEEKQGKPGETDKGVD